MEIEELLFFLLAIVSLGLWPCVYITLGKRCVCICSLPIVLLLFECLINEEDLSNLMYVVTLLYVTGDVQMQWKTKYIVLY